MGMDVLGGVNRIIGPNRGAIDFPPEFKWLNTSEPLSAGKLRGQVVVLDFWTYCCINCMHMLPVLAKIEDAYKDKPVAVIGVHSAKFPNEQRPENIQEAVRRYEMRHPVIVDEDRRLWKAFGASAWPTIVVLGPDWRVQYKRAGEVPFSELDGAVESVLIDRRYEGMLAKGPLKLSVPKTAAGGVLSYPGKMSLSPDEARFAISDSNHNRILIVETASGRVVDAVGSGARGLRDGGFAECTFFRPQGVLWLGSGTVYVADTENHALREVDLEARTVKTIAGDGTQGPYQPFEYSGLGAKTRLSSPWDLAYHRHKLLVAMAGLHQIWAYDIGTGTIYPFGGSGMENIFDGPLTNAQFAQPSGLSINADNDHMYVADSEVSGVRSIDLKGRFVSTLVGSGLFKFGYKDGTFYEARMQHPLGVAAIGDKIYVADTYNSAIRVIDVAHDSVSTVIGSPGSKSFCKFGEGGCDTLGLYEPSDVKASRNGRTLYVVDTNNHLVRTFSFDDFMLRTLALRERD